MTLFGRLNLSCVDSPLKYRAVLLDDACYSGLDESSDIEGLDDPNGEDECHTGEYIYHTNLSMKTPLMTTFFIFRNHNSR